MLNKQQVRVLAASTLQTVECSVSRRFAAHKSIFPALLLGVTLTAQSLLAQIFIAYDAPPGTLGNQALPGIVVGNDFRVVRPITITQLGVFDSGTNGIWGSTVLTVQLYERSGRHAGTLLESMTFDATNPGQRIGANLFKPLATPLTLLPGNYTIAGYGFDDTEPYGNAGTPPLSTNSPPPWFVNDGGGLIRFEGLARFGRNAAGQYPGHLDAGPANRFAAGTFIFAEATLPTPPHAADYAALTAGVSTFPIEDARHLGSIAVLNSNSFPVLVEQGGNRIVSEAAGSFNDDPNAARAVVFAHTQWGHAPSDARATLFDDAVRWVSRKNDPVTIVVGVTTNLDASYFASRGYQVTPIVCDDLTPTNCLPPMDVLVAEWDPQNGNPPVDQIKEFTAAGGGLVLTLTPRFHAYPLIRPSFTNANEVLRPFGVAYRSSLAIPADYGFTNVQAMAYPPEFSAFPAASLLHQGRLGAISLNSQEKAIALNTITYAAYGRPDLLTQLTAVYSGSLNNGTGQFSGNFSDAVTLSGAQATTNWLGRWFVVGNDLVAVDRRGAVEYQFTAPASTVYRLQIEGAQNSTNSLSNDFDLVLSVDGQSLGRYTLTAGYGSNGVVQCFTPFLLTGPHTVRVFWDGAASLTALRLKTVRLQIGGGPDNDGNGIQDWVDELVQSQSGLDLTNAVIASYTSPVCVEGRDPYPALMSLTIDNADDLTPGLAPEPAPDDRWFANVPLSAYVNAQTTLRVTYQNGARTETRQLQWLPLNLMTDGDRTIRKGDSLLFNAKPPGSPDSSFTLTVSTNQFNARTEQPRAYQFNQVGAYTVTGTYLPGGGSTAQSRSIIVNVVEHSFTNTSTASSSGPDCWVGRERTWDLPSVATQVVIEADSRLFCEETGTLPNNGRELNLLTDESSPCCIVSRLGDGGPILGSVKANGFRVFAAPDTYNWVIETYPDGSRLVETMIILSPLPTDVTVQLKVIVGGVTFDDGSTYRELSPADFDALGQYTFRFLMPASVQTANCHSVTVIQGAADLMGSY